ncbi:cytochrome C oxidase subunit II [Cohnella terricola]|uniref:Cytochrome C oxidase subunit II n=1 Tax=Cohnella terricola TaxID=1289167 RepID=A0A559JEJ9_9BACL|nr:cytochrome C oxidase subunit II [Cohnella terricola]TVX98314.1 cytochrome C oxidase subunit II [Cohnella terricola]
MQKNIIYFLVIAALALTLSACGGKNTDSDKNSQATEEAASQEVVIKASSWEFDQTEYALPKDTPVKLTVENISGAHGIEIIGQDIQIRGGKSKVVNLPAGTYEFKCNIMCGTGHSKMVAKLVVS